MPIEGPAISQTASGRQLTRINPFNSQPVSRVRDFLGRALAKRRWSKEIGKCAFGVRRRTVVVSTSSAERLPRAPVLTTGPFYGRHRIGTNCCLTFRSQKRCKCLQQKFTSADKRSVIVSVNIGRVKFLPSRCKGLPQPQLLTPKPSP